MVAEEPVATPITYFAVNAGAQQEPMDETASIKDQGSEKLVWHPFREVVSPLLVATRIRLWRHVNASR